MKKNFFIPQIKEKEEKKETVEEEKKEQGFTSPAGTRQQNKIVYSSISYGNKGMQYESYRDKDKKTENTEEINRRFLETYGSQSNLIQSERKSQANAAKIPSYLQREDITPEDVKRKREYNLDLTQEGEVVKTIDRSELFKDEVKKEPEQKPDLRTIEREYFEELEPVTELSEEKRPRRSRSEPVFRKDDSDGQSIILEEEIRNQKVREFQTEFEEKTTTKRKRRRYRAPSLDLLDQGRGHLQIDKVASQKQIDTINQTLEEFGISGEVVNYVKGPAVTQFEISLGGGVKVERVQNISRNLQMNLECKSLRIEAPIPGKSTVGIEVPNPVQEIVYLGDMLRDKTFLNDGNPLNVALGIAIDGSPIHLNIKEMPHALIAGTPGSGKSVCLNSIIMSIIYKADPSEVKLILIDPKFIEFSNFEDIPHLATPIINESKIAQGSLRWAVDEMENRYLKFKSAKRKNIASYNEYMEETNGEKLPYFVIIIDELADLMAIAGNQVEEYIQRIAQKARAAGIHLIMATQRPSTDVIKGTVKANILTRIAFAVTSQVDSFTILDKSGAEELLGKGDMLYTDGVNEYRIQGAYVSEKEIIRITKFLNETYEPEYMFDQEDLREKIVQEHMADTDPRNDELFEPVARYVVEMQTGSISSIQSRFKVGFTRAQSLMHGLEMLEIVSENKGTTSRDVLVKTLEELEEKLNGDY
ncbi:MAG TPA: DNA translocase FtsK [Bacilli bacterium]|nr:DNA translocase FtsK [Bacilli bacterium]